MEGTRTTKRRRTMRHLSAPALGLLSLAAGGAAGARLRAPPRDPMLADPDEHATAAGERRRLLAGMRRERALAAHRGAAGTSGLTSGPQPLDLVLDEADPSSYPAVFRRGAGGELLPYDPDGDAAAPAADDGGDGGTGEGAPVIHLSFRGAVDAGSDGGTGDDGGGSRSPGGHYWSDRVGYTNFDLRRGVGRDEDDEDFAAEEVERRAQREGARGLRGEEGGDGALPLFVYGEHDDPHESAELVPDLDGEDGLRRLKYAGHSKTSQADSFASSHDPRPNGTKKDRLDEADAAEDKSVPVIVSAFPPINTKIGDRQSFGALVRDVGGSGVRSACVQLQDHVRARSPCLKLKHVGEGRGDSGVYELTLDGFDAFKGKKWSYRIMGKDNNRNRRRTGWRSFEISDPGAVVEEEEEATTTADATGAPVTTAPSAPARLFETVGDENWPHGGEFCHFPPRVV